MILLDTSAIIEFDRGTGSEVHHRVRSLLVVGDRHAEVVAVTDPVVAEVMTGARTDADAEVLGRFLARFALVPCLSPTDYEAAVVIYRACRRAGFTPRGLVDCIIAAVALRNDATLLCRDVDLERIADVVPLRLDVPPR